MGTDSIESFERNGNLLPIWQRRRGAVVTVGVKFAPFLRNGHAWVTRVLAFGCGEKFFNLEHPAESAATLGRIVPGRRLDRT